MQNLVLVKTAILAKIIIFVIMKNVIEAICAIIAIKTANLKVMN